jgi:hypothetical protein
MSGLFGSHGCQLLVIGPETRAVLFATGFIPVVYGLLHYTDHTEVETEVVQRPVSTGVNPVAEFDFG